VRFCDYRSDTKTFVVPEENPLGASDDPCLGRVSWCVCSRDHTSVARGPSIRLRPAQQYEFLKSSDVRWATVRGAFTNAVEKGNGGTRPH
jgi:hypothetical protein